jgi:hypothetical protein
MDKWMDIAIRWCAGVITLVVLATLGLDPNLIVWLIVYAGVFFGCWGIGNIVVAGAETFWQYMEGRHD